MSAFGIDRSSIFINIFSLLLNNYFKHKEQVEKLVKDSKLLGKELKARAEKGKIILEEL